MSITSVRSVHPTSHFPSVRALLASEDRWSRGAEARTPGGRPCSFDTHGAARWDLNGALRLVYHNASTTYQNYTYARIVWAIARLAGKPVQSIAEWQDAPERTFSEIRAVTQLANV